MERQVIRRGCGGGCCGSNPLGGRVVVKDRMSLQVPPIRPRCSSVSDLCRQEMNQITGGQLKAPKSANAVYKDSQFQFRTNEYGHLKVPGNPNVNRYPMGNNSTQIISGSHNNAGYRQETQSRAHQAKVGYVAYYDKENMPRSTKARVPVRSSLPTRPVSPIRPHAMADNSWMNTTKQCPRRPKVKRRTTQDMNVGVLYNYEYLNDIIEVVMTQEKDIVLPHKFFQTYNSGQEYYRAGIVNWFLYIQMRNKISDTVFYLSVNLMDQVFARIFVPVNMYQLLILTTYWINQKMTNGKEILSGDIVALCGNIYSRQQLKRLERKILELISFHLNTIEPTIVSNYYLIKLTIANIPLAEASTSFFLDCYSLKPDFSSYPTSLLAAAAVSLTIKMCMSSSRDRIEKFFSGILFADEIKIKNYLESQMFASMEMVKNENYEFREAYFKYKLM